MLNFGKIYNPNHDCHCNGRLQNAPGQKWLHDRGNCWLDMGIHHAFSTDNNTPCCRCASHMLNEGQVSLYIHSSIQLGAITTPSLVIFLKSEFFNNSTIHNYYTMRTAR